MVTCRVCRKGKLRESGTVSTITAFREILLLCLNVFNDVILLFFAVCNGIYTVLAFISLGFVWLSQKRVQYATLRELRNSPVTPPVTIIVPAYNEEGAILSTVESLMGLDYPVKEIIVVDDGSKDGMLLKLIEKYQLIQMDLIWRPRLPATQPTAYFVNPKFPALTVVSKPNGGKPDALNVGINMARSPYVCTVDADCLVERSALLRLMHPVITSPINTVATAGIVRILNGCKVTNGVVSDVRLPTRPIELFQIVEYLRSFQYGRPGWSAIGASFVASGAFCIFHTETLIEVGGFHRDTVTEDADIIICLHRLMCDKKRKYRIAFTTYPVCWTVAPHTIDLLAKQRRRWQLGLFQTVMKHNDILFRWKYGLLGMVSLPFHTFVEAFGCLVEFLGYLVIPFSFILGVTPFSIFMLFILLATVYGAMLSVAGILLAEMTYRRYPRMLDMLKLLGYAIIENLGYRQMGSFFRVQAMWQYIIGKKKWEVVQHAVGEVQAS